MVDTHGERIDFGKHKGELFTRLPVSYLRWLANEPELGPKREGQLAEAELLRRGTHTPVVEISGHAIDRASLRCRKIWHEDRGDEEGLHAWLCRICEECNLLERPERVEHKDMVLVFQYGYHFPTLKTIMRKK